MAATSIKTRFAPSPTGFLHLGNARIALFCALHARQAEGIFLLRIEDTDSERSSEPYIKALQDDLLWMGLDWQEGPEREGAQAPYVQSQRSAIYHEYFVSLERDGHAYPCFCSEHELALGRKTQLAARQAPRYPGTCAALSAAAIRAKLNQDLRPTLRFRVPRGRTIIFNDLVRGPQTFASDDIGDFVIRRADGTPAFFFSNGLDDAVMGVTHVLRGEDHLSNTPRQLMLLEALALNPPQYGHVSLILGADGAPLSKRHGSCSVRELREAGYFPEAVNNYLARLGHTYENNDFMDFDGLTSGFKLHKIGLSPAHFDAIHLQHWQQQAIARADHDRLWRWMGTAVHGTVPQDQAITFVEAIRANVETPEQALRWAHILYSEDIAPSPAAGQVIARAGTAFFEQAACALEQCQMDFKCLTAEIKKTMAVSGKALFQPLRAALTGELDGPEMVHLLPLIGLQRARTRLCKAAAKG
jgi:glutamyl-tRNA synthetase